MRTKSAAVVAATAVTLLASAALAAPTVTITSPGAGSVVSRSTTPQITMTGTAAFDVPQPAERTFYVRRTSCNADQRLSINRGVESASCAQVVSFTPIAEETASAVTYDAENGVPFTLDASKPITGVVSLVSYIGAGAQGAGAGLTTVDIAVMGEQVGSGAVVLGSTTVSYTATPAQNQYDTPWSFQPHSSLDKQDFNSLQLALTVRGRNALHGFTRPNSTKFTVPIYTASFNRKVEVAVDTGAFSAAAVTLAPDLATWTATIPTPSVGIHSLKARAVQGATVSDVAQRSITVTS